MDQASAEVVAAAAAGRAAGLAGPRGNVAASALLVSGAAAARGRGGEGGGRWATRLWQQGLSAPRPCIAHCCMSGAYRLDAPLQRSSEVWDEAWGSGEAILGCWLAGEGAVGEWWAVLAT